MNETERHGGQEISTSVNNMEVEGATKQMVEHWDVTKLTSWLNKALDPPLHPQDMKKIEKERIDGPAFLAGAGDRSVFREAGVSVGASVNLANLATKIKGTAIQGKLLPFISYSKH
jgi:hypothetical protein